jgi:hypothetical protein
MDRLVTGFAQRYQVLREANNPKAISAVMCLGCNCLMAALTAASSASNHLGP